MTILIAGGIALLLIGLTLKPRPAHTYAAHEALVEAELARLKTLGIEPRGIEGDV